ncbi:MAG: PstS family phosphate ABC transporter substrate-binding protein [Burkholderiales bacterium]|nr:PstS family phosphate ABC transporter substrate-binding protein [Burkholderiales bacterium]
MMQFHKSMAVAAALAGIALAPAALADIVKIDGSSTVFPVTEAVAEDFQKSTGGKYKVTVGISGTGGGFKKFCRGVTDISDASRPILAKEMEECRKSGITYIELPVAFDALTVMVNPKNTFIKQMTVAELKKIWEPGAQGMVTKWSQVNPEWPDAPLKLFGAGADSGTFDYFTEAIVGKAKSSRGDFTASEDDNVLVQGIARDVNALGFFGYAYYAENTDKLKAVAIVEKAGASGVLPSEKTVLDGTYQPLSRPIFIYVNAKSLQKPEVKQFVEYYLTHGPKLAKEVKYVPLPAGAYEIGKKRLANVETGTGFGGIAEVGVKLDELLARPLKQ